MAWMYADNMELQRRNYRWWRDGKGETPAHGNTAQGRLEFFWRMHQSHIPDSDRFFEDLFAIKVGLEPRLDGPRLEAWKACFARLTMTYKRDVKRDLTALRAWHYQQLAQAVRALEAALAPFGERFDPKVDVTIGRASMTSDELIAWAEQELARRGDGGRPDVVVFDRVVIHLLWLYMAAFGRKPSYASRTGPTARYVGAFFSLLTGAVTAEFGDLVRSSPEASKRLSKLLRPSQIAIREVVRRNAPKVLDTPPPGWMGDIGLFAADPMAEPPSGEHPTPH